MEIFQWTTLSSWKLNSFCNPIYLNKEILQLFRSPNSPLSWKTIVVYQIESVVDDVVHDVGDQSSHSLLLSCSLCQQVIHQRINEHMSSHIIAAGATHPHPFWINCAVVPMFSFSLCYATKGRRMESTWVRFCCFDNSSCHESCYSSDVAQQLHCFIVPPCLLFDLFPYFNFIADIQFHSPLDPLSQHI